ncbi:MAG TPA: LysM domain-containing protein, partial [Anaerolineaceae bacterium]
MDEGDPRVPAREAERNPSAEKPGRRKGWLGAWEWLVQQGLGEPALRIGTSVISILLFLVVIWVMSTFYVHGPELIAPAAAFSSAQATSTPLYQPNKVQDVTVSVPSSGISRLAQIHTDRPVGTSFEIARYTVQAGDTVFGIADRFNVTPQTILWGNLNVLADNPEWLTPGQVLNILPVDGVLYQWRAGDGLN